MSDAEFIAELYEQHEQMLYRVAFNILRNSADAEDAVQECFVRIIKNLEKIRAVPCNELRFYLVIVVRNTALTLFNRKTRHIELDIDEQYGLASGDTPEEEFLRSHTIGEIRGAVQQLSPSDCDVMWLSLFRGLSPGEIAELLGQKPATVRSRISRAKRRLILILEERGITADDRARGTGTAVPGKNNAGLRR